MSFFLFVMSGQLKCHNCLNEVKFTFGNTKVVQLYTNNCVFNFLSARFEEEDFIECANS